MNLNYLKYLPLLTELLSIFETLKEIGGPGIEVRPTYKSKKFSILIKRTK